MAPTSHNPHELAPGAARVMGPRRPFRVFALAMLLALCSNLVLPSGEAAEPIPDFQLQDVNPSSPRYNRSVSPRDYRLQISAFYFGAAG